MTRRTYKTPPDRFQPFKNIRVGITSLEKLCTLCGHWRPLNYEHWQRDSSRAYGFKSQCKICLNSYSKKYWLERLAPEVL